MISNAIVQQENFTSVACLSLDFLACCPSCGTKSHFSYCGTQQFSARVANLAGLPTELHLFNCDQCGSTISHNELHP